MLYCAKCQKEWGNDPIVPPLCPTCRCPLIQSATSRGNIVINEAAERESERISRRIRFATQLGATSQDTLRLPYLEDPVVPVIPKIRILSKNGDHGTRQPDYTLLEKLGQGGMGEVTAAQQTVLERIVAVKQLPEFGVTAGDHARFRSEALITSSLDHPNIIPIYDLGVDELGRAFFAMKKVHGTHWGTRMAQMSESENLEILIRVCDAVAFAHARGVIHRDLKPENIMIGEFGEILVMDWGLAIKIDDLRRESEQYVDGTPAYMPPEMMRCDVRTIGPRSDIYLLGGCLFKIITGNAPHTGMSVQTCVSNALNNVIAPIAQAGELADISLRALASDPEQRFATVGDFQAAVRAYRGHAESHRLCENAVTAFATAKQTRRHDLYARAIAGNEQALVLWADNQRAITGLQHTRRAFAEHALDVGDVDLARSLVDRMRETEPNGHDSLARKVSAATRARASARRRNRLLVITATIASALVLIISVSAALVMQHERIQVLSAIRDRDTAESPNFKRKPCIGNRLT